MAPSGEDQLLCCWFRVDSWRCDGVPLAVTRVAEDMLPAHNLTVWHIWRARRRFPQNDIYSSCLKHYRERHQFIGFIDADEVCE